MIAPPKGMRRLVSWAPPEQIEGAPAHPSADVYAFGRVMSFFLTGSQDKASIQKVPGHWAEILAPCVDVTPGKRPEVNFVRSRIEQIP
mgnify:CR=1 FL=1